jgi:nucleotide-binding universal stress UspA family protein
MGCNKGDRTMYRTILVPLDGSSFGEWALPVAIGLARQAKAKLELVSIHVPLSVSRLAGETPGYDVSWETKLQEPLAQYQAGVAKRLAALDIAFERALKCGPIRETLLSHAHEVGADLLVMSTHGHGPLKRAWLGSVADAVVRESPVPVLLVRPEEGQPPDFTQERVFRDILIPLDGSGHSEEILTAAKALGEAGNASFTLVKVVLPPQMMTVPYAYVPVAFDAAGLHEDAKAAAGSYLDGVAEYLRRRNTVVNTGVLVGTSAAATILEFAEGEKYDLIALSTHGWGGLRFPLGSVADKIVRGALVPVLAYHPRAHR